ncbi:MAG: carbon-nitrogen hydrolase family protein [Myxococcota bacterium]
MSQRFLLACVQLHSSDQIEKNLESCRKWIKRAVQRGAEWVLLPEDYGFLAKNEEDKKALSDAQRTQIRESVREEAMRYGIYLLAGGYPVQAEEGRLYNRATLFSPQGVEIASYDKIHLFDAHPPGATPLLESAQVQAGNRLIVAQTPLCTVGFSICYDLRFPELYRAMARAGAELLVVPAAFTLTTGKDHWKPLLQARAIENQCYVAAAAQWGKHSERRFSFGSSLICDPWGTILATAPESEGVLLAEFDPERLAQVQTHVPCRQHVREDLFAFAEAQFDIKGA